MIANGDCLDLMYDLWDESIDLIICDPPYGVTNYKWDKVIDIQHMFYHFRRIIKPTGVILIFGREPFMSKVRIEGEDIYKYDWTWIKSRANGQVHSSTSPLQNTETIAVFSKGNRCSTSKTKLKFNLVNGFPRTTINFSNCPLREMFHPCQKPIELADFLIKTHSDEDNIILDPCFGSGTFLLSAKNNNRKFIGFEKEEDYINIARLRLKHGRIFSLAKTKAKNNELQEERNS